MKKDSIDILVESLVKGKLKLNKIIKNRKL